MANPSVYELYMIELINRARLDPETESQRLGIPLDKDLSPGTISPTPKQPLAVDTRLIDAARMHSQWMLDNDIFSHTETVNSNTPQPVDRMIAAGYPTPSVAGENIAWNGTTASTFDEKQFTYENYVGLFDSAGHRQNMLYENYRDIGVGALKGYFTTNNISYYGQMVTQNFATAGTQVYVTGVSYFDMNGNGIFDPGEEISSTFTSKISGAASNSHSTSGIYYSHAFGANDVVEVSKGSITVKLQLNGKNVKVDFVDGISGVTVKVSDSAEMLTNASINGPFLELIGANPANLTGGPGDDILTGNRVDNVLTGGLGNDTLHGKEGNDILKASDGNDTLYGGAGADAFVFEPPTTSTSPQHQIRDFNPLEGDWILFQSWGTNNLRPYHINIQNAKITTPNVTIDLYGYTNTDPIITVIKYGTFTDAEIRQKTYKSVDVTWHDWANVRNYVTYTEVYDANAQKARQYGTYDNGSTWDFYWDLNNSYNWSARYDYYDAQGRKYLEQGDYDSGGRWIRNIDVNNSANYSYYTTYYDTQNRPTTQSTQYDSGGYAIKNWDPGNQYAYSEYTTYYDAQGRPDSQNGIYDNPPQAGVDHWWKDFDQDNTKPWAELTVWYDAQGNVVTQWLTMDDGSIVYI